MARRIKAARRAGAPTPARATGADRAPAAAVSLSGPLGVRRRRRPLRNARHPAPGRRAVTLPPWTWCSTPSPRASPGRRWWACCARRISRSKTSSGSTCRSRRSARSIGRWPRRATSAGSIDSPRSRTAGTQPRVRQVVRAVAGVWPARPWMWRSILRGELAPLASLDPVLRQLEHRANLPVAPSSAAGARSRPGAERSGAPGRDRRARGARRRVRQSMTPAPEVTGGELSSTIRRWLGGQTFARSDGRRGASACWTRRRPASPTSTRRSCWAWSRESGPSRLGAASSTPPVLLGLLDPAPAADDPNRRESEARAAARAAFVDLLGLARHRVRASAFCAGIRRDRRALARSRTTSAPLGLPLEVADRHRRQRRFSRRRRCWPARPCSTRCHRWLAPGPRAGRIARPRRPALPGRGRPLGDCPG